MGMIELDRLFTTTNKAEDAGMWGKIKCKGVKNKRIDCRVEVLP